MDKNSLRIYLSMLWQKRLTPLQVLKAMKKNSFLLNKRDKKFLLSLLKDIEKHRLAINGEILEEIIKMSQLNSCQKGAF